MRKYFTLILLQLIVKLSLQDSYNCPVMSCWQTLYKDRCLEMNYELPKSQHIRFAKCQGSKICNYKQDSTYLWPVSPTDIVGKTDISDGDLWGYCTESFSWENGQLLPGRSCAHDYQCYSNLCDNGKCRGLIYPQVCRNSKDCEVGYRCVTDTSYQSSKISRNVCQKVLKEGDQCTSDADCQVQLVCAQSSSSTTKCQKAYSLNIGDQAYDGRVCKSGAINSKNKCAMTSSIKFKDKALAYPYKCSPDTSQKCQKLDSSGNSITYNGDQMIAKFSAQKDFCQCSNYTNGTNVAYCIPYGDQLWTDLWTFYNTKIQPFLDNCHSLDRLNPIAWIDCGQAIYEEDATYWANTYSSLSFYQFSYSSQGQDCEDAISHMGSYNWNKLISTISQVEFSASKTRMVVSAGLMLLNLFIVLSL